MALASLRLDSHRYLAEFQYRFNRRFNLRTIFKHAAPGAGGRPGVP
jgi:hypothetical protein